MNFKLPRIRIKARKCYIRAHDPVPFERHGMHAVGLVLAQELVSGVLFRLVALLLMSCVAGGALPVRAGIATASGTRIPLGPQPFLAVQAVPATRGFFS